MSGWSEPRLEPIGNTFINWPPACGCGTLLPPQPAPLQGSARARARSFPGYITYSLSQRSVDVGELKQTLIPLTTNTARQLPGASKRGGAKLRCRRESSESGISDLETYQFVPSITDASTCAESKTCASACELSVDSGSEVLATRAVKVAGKLAKGTTTLMIRNLPHDIMQTDLISEIDGCGFHATYDFLYMPSNFCSGHGKGYAFVNFALARDAERFASLWHRSHRFGPGGVEGRPMALSISAAAVQGRSANIRKWDVPRMHRVKNPSFRPLIAVPAPHGRGGAVLLPSSAVPAEAFLA